jgi:hypothetical protein
MMRLSKDFCRRFNFDEQLFRTALTCIARLRERIVNFSSLWNSTLREHFP